MNKRMPTKCLDCKFRRINRKRTGVVGRWQKYCKICAAHRKSKAVYIAAHERRMKKLKNRKCLDCGKRIEFELHGAIKRCNWCRGERLKEKQRGYSDTRDKNKVVQACVDCGKKSWMFKQQRHCSACKIERHDLFLSLSRRRR